MRSVASVASNSCASSSRVRAVDELPGRRVALVARAGAPLHELRAGERTLLVGAERAGLPDEVVALADRVAHIPIAGDSLNAAMATTVALYELANPRIAQ